MKSFKYILLLFGLLLVSNLLAERVEKEKIIISNDLVVVSNTTLGGNVTIGNETRSNWPTELTNTTTMIYVDSNRTNDYNENGSITYPYKTIMGAINRVITNGDNSWDNQIQYVINIAGGLYYENVTIENTNLVYLSFVGDGYVIVYPPSGNALQSITNNNSLHFLSFKGLSFYGPFIMDCHTNNLLASLEISDCLLNGTTILTSLKAGRISGVGAIYGNFSVINCGIFEVLVNVSGGTCQCLYDITKPNPAGYTPYLVFGARVEQSPVYCGSNAIVQYRSGVRGINPGATLTVDGTIENYSGVILGNIIINSNGVFNNWGGWYNPGTLTVNPGGEFNDYGDIMGSSAVYPNIIYVDSNRTNSYTETGSQLYPYKTIMGAVNKVIANGDNSWLNQREYIIDVMGGFYYESVILESTNLAYLTIKSEGVSLIYPPSGNALQSTTNNNNLYLFNMRGFMLDGPVVLTGNPTMTGFVPYFIDCDFYFGVSLTCVAAADFSGRSGIVGGNFSAINCGVVALRFTLGAGGSGYSCSYNTNLPYIAGIYPSLIFESPTETPSIYCGTNAEVQFRAGSRVVAPGNTLTIDGTVINYGGLVRGNIVVNSNGTFDTYGGWYNRSTLTINPGGTVNDYNTSGGATNQIVSFNGTIYTITNNPVSKGDVLFFDPGTSNAWFGGNFLKLITITNDSDQTNDLVVTGVGFAPTSVRIFTPSESDPLASQSQMLAYKDGIYILDNTWAENLWQFSTGGSMGNILLSLKSWDTDGITLSREISYMDATNSLTYRFVFYR